MPEKKQQTMVDGMAEVADIFEDAVILYRRFRKQYEAALRRWLLRDGIYNPLSNFFRTTPNIGIRGVGGSAYSYYLNLWNSLGRPTGDFRTWLRRVGIDPDSI